MTPAKCSQTAKQRLCMGGNAVHHAQHGFEVIITHSPAIEKNFYSAFFTETVCLCIKALRFLKYSRFEKVFDLKITLILPWHTQFIFRINIDSLPRNPSPGRLSVF